MEKHNDVSVGTRASIRAGKKPRASKDGTLSGEKARRRSYGERFKARMMIEVMKGEQTLVEIAEENGMPKETLSQWKQELLARLPAIFDDFMLKHGRTHREVELEREVAKLRMRIVWMKKIKQVQWWGEF